MTPLYFYLWGHLKSLVYKTQILSEQDLIGRIIEASAMICIIAEAPNLMSKFVQESEGHPVYEVMK